MTGAVPSRSQRWLLALAAAIALLLGAFSAPALAHKEHKKKPAQTEQVMPAPQGAAVQPGSPMAGHANMGEMMESEGTDRSQMSLLQRLVDWLGRTHPVIVHFPIAFFPAALFTAIVGRRRPAFAKPVQFLVIAGGIIAPIAAIFGWLDAMAAEETALLEVHEWLGTAIGAAGLLLAIWAWRRPDQDRSTGMIVALGAITAAIVIQGWYGGAMVHGIDHMNW